MSEAADHLSDSDGEEAGTVVPGANWWCGRGRVREIFDDGDVLQYANPRHHLEGATALIGVCIYRPKWGWFRLGLLPLKMKHFSVCKDLLQEGVHQEFPRARFGNQFRHLRTNLRAMLCDPRCLPHHTRNRS